MIVFTIRKTFWKYHCVKISNDEKKYDGTNH